MSKFSEEYIELCRKLALPREWQKGDVCKTSYPTDEPHYMMTTPTFPVRKDLTWLPLEGDWLDLLEAEDAYPVLLVSLRPAKDGSGYGIDTAEGDDGDCYFGPDRLTALAKLYATAHDIDLADLAAPHGEKAT